MSTTGSVGTADEPSSGATSSPAEGSPPLAAPAANAGEIPEASSGVGAPPTGGAAPSSSSPPGADGGAAADSPPGGSSAPPPSDSTSTFLFTSESVTESHPDKLCDVISDAVVDACLTLDPASRVACECVCKTGVVIVLGEITTSASINYEQVIRDAVRDAGYDDPAKGLDYKTCNVIVALEEQSPDVAQAVDASKLDDLGAGDSCVAFGYATDETPERMPASHVLATKLAARLASVRKDGTLDWIRPDGKAQVTLEYGRAPGGGLTPLRVATVVLSAQHSEDVSNDKIAADLMEHVVRPVVPAELLDDRTVYHLNPSGRFVIGGPHSDAGMTGRKSGADSYGGWGRDGSGSFSGKDATKPDRGGSYAARWVAKSLVANGYCGRCLVQLSYAIGLSHPVSVHVETYGTCRGKNGKGEADLASLVKETFDLKPGAIIRELDLRRPIMRKTAAYGHFGREEEEFKWEQVKEF